MAERGGKSQDKKPDPYIQLPNGGPLMPRPAWMDKILGPNGQPITGKPKPSKK